MKAIDPGHHYVLDTLDGYAPQHLIFVKRVGEKYPGNVGEHLGTTTQEVLRALIERSRYVNAQTPCDETTLVIGLLQSALYLLEVRAARQHERALNASLADMETGRDKCIDCGHHGCQGDCRPARSLL
jgi:hypothetical protein